MANVEVEDKSASQEETPTPFGQVVFNKLWNSVTNVGSISSLRPNPRRSKTRGLVLAFVAVLLVYNGVQVVQSIFSTMEGVSSLIQLTYIDADENDQAAVRHPFYTICPILDKMASLDDPNATLVSVMVENSIYHPLVNFLPVFNSPK